MWLLVASRHFPSVPRFQQHTFGHRAFAVGVWWLVTHYRRISVIHGSAAVASGVVWKLYRLQDTSVFSATEMLHDIALHKFNVDIDIEQRFTVKKEAKTLRHVLIAGRQWRQRAVPQATASSSTTIVSWRRPAYRQHRIHTSCCLPHSKLPAQIKHVIII